MLAIGRALALLSERDASSCGHCSEKGATVSKAAPPIIPSMPSFFMIGLPDDNPGLAKCSSRVNGTTITDTGERFKVPGHPASARMSLR
jgi:hypothetical protein